MKNIILILTLLLQYAYANDNYYYQNNKKVLLSPYNSTLRSNIDIDYYQNDAGIVLGVRDRLIVKIKDSKNLAQLLSEFNLTIQKTLSKELYLLKVPNKNLTIDIANRLSEQEYIEYAHPDFTKRRMSR
ncbi:MAG: hypothetical protein Q9M34_12160 [Sulfurimonas sp.]|nr:hypothetical protein [Sulfurimonas sp.]